MAPGSLSQQHPTHPTSPQQAQFGGGCVDLIGLPGVPRMYIPYFRSGPKDRGKDQASGPAWPTQASQEWSSHLVQLFSSPVGRGGSLLGPDSSYLSRMGAYFPFLSPSLKGRRAAACSTGPSVRPALTCVWMCCSLQVCTGKGPQKYRGEARQHCTSRVRSRGETLEFLSSLTTLRCGHSDP